MRAFLLLGLALVVACATAEDDGLGPADSGLDASGGTSTTGGKGGTGGGKGGTGGFGATGGTSGTGGFTGGSGGLGASGGATGGLGGADAGDAGDGGPATGFGSCVTQAEFDAQSSNAMGFCNGLPFACLFACPNEATKPGEVVCSPICVCAPMPPICAADAGADADAALDAGTDADASDASAD